MKRVLLVVVLAGLIAGLAQAQTPQVRLVWEKTINDRFLGVVLESPDSLNPRAIVLGPHDKYTISSNGDITTFRDLPAWEETEQQRQQMQGLQATRLVSSSRQFTVWNYRWGDVSEFPLRSKVYDREGHLLFRRQGEKIQAISERGPLFVATNRGQPLMNLPFADTIFLIDVRGNLVRSLVTPRVDRVIFSPDEERFFVRCQIARNRPGADAVPVGDLSAFDRGGNKLWETNGARLSAFVVSQIGRVFGISKRPDGIWGVFYRPDGAKEGEVIIDQRADFAAGGFKEGDLAVTVSGDTAIVCDGASLKVLANRPARMLAQVKPLSSGGFQWACVDPRGRGFWAVYKLLKVGGPTDPDGPSKLYLVSTSGQMRLEIEYASPFNRVITDGKHLILTGRIVRFEPSPANPKLFTRQLPDQTAVALFELR